MTPATIAEQVELEVSDALADLTMIWRLVTSSPEWTTPLPPNAVGAPLRIRMADRWLGGWTREEWQTRFDGFDAPSMRGLTQQWIVATFSRWEEVHRKRLIAAGDPGNVDIFGDLRHLRIDIVHHDAISTADHGARCKLLTEFPAGALIALRPEHFVTIMDELAGWVANLGGTSHGQIVRDTKGRKA